MGVCEDAVVLVVPLLEPLVCWTPAFSTGVRGEDAPDAVEVFFPFPEFLGHDDEDGVWAGGLDLRERLFEEVGGAFAE